MNFKAAGISSLVYNLLLLASSANNNSQSKFCVGLYEQIDKIYFYTSTYSLNERISGSSIAVALAQSMWYNDPKYD